MHARGRGTGRSCDAGEIGATAATVAKTEQVATTATLGAINPLLGAAAAGVFALGNALVGGTKPTDPPLVPPVDALLADWLKAGGAYAVTMPGMTVQLVDSRGHVAAEGANNFNFFAKYGGNLPSDTRISATGRLYLPAIADVIAPVAVVPGVPLVPQRSAFLQSVEDMNASVSNLSRLPVTSVFTQANALMRDAASQLGPVRMVPKAAPVPASSAAKALGVLGAVGAIAAIAWKARVLL